MSDDQHPPLSARELAAIDHVSEKYHWAMAALAAYDTTGNPDGLGALLEKAGLSRTEADALLSDLTRVFPETQRRWDWVLDERAETLGGTTPYEAVGQGRVAEVYGALAALG